jgi:hypothetical protein
MGKLSIPNQQMYNVEQESFSRFNIGSQGPGMARPLTASYLRDI